MGRKAIVAIREILDHLDLKETLGPKVYLIFKIMC
jgi:hypothetical protein